jgi:hypothetical protein
LSFSAHADSKGILKLIHYCQPQNIMLVHGEKSKMSILKSKIEQELGIPCYDPPNGQIISIETKKDIPINVSVSLLNSLLTTRDKWICDQSDWNGESEALNPERYTEQIDLCKSLSILLHLCFQYVQIRKMYFQSYLVMTVFPWMVFLSWNPTKYGNNSIIYFI